MFEKISSPLKTWLMEIQIVFLFFFSILDNTRNVCRHISKKHQRIYFVNLFTLSLRKHFKLVHPAAGGKYWVNKYWTMDFAIMANTDVQLMSTDKLWLNAHCCFKNIETFWWSNQYRYKPYVWIYIVTWLLFLYSKQPETMYFRHKLLDIYCHHR